MERRRTKAEIAHGTKLKRNAQAVCIATVSLNKGMILLGEGEIGDQVPVGNVIRKTCKSFPLFGGQKGPRHSVAPSVIKKGVCRWVHGGHGNQGLFHGTIGRHKGLPI